MTPSDCNHAGSVWRVHILTGLHGSYQPGTWECTRCGQQWDEHPVVTRIRGVT